MELKGSHKNKPTKSKGWFEIRKILAKSTDRDLLKIISELYALSKDNKNFLDSRFFQDKSTIASYKKIIAVNLTPSNSKLRYLNPWDYASAVSLKNAKKALSDYKKATGDEYGLIELMIYYVECGTAVSLSHGDMYDQYYGSLVSVFKSALLLMGKYSHEEMLPFIDRVKLLIKKTRNIGWGYFETLHYLFKNSYETDSIGE